MKLDRNKVFCVENSSYEHMIACQQGVKFDEDDIYSQIVSWRKTSIEMRRLLKHVSGLTPHKVRDTMSLNDARQFMKIIRPFLSKLLENINENSIRIMKYEHDLRAQDETVENIESDVNLRQIDINIVPIDTAITFCTSIRCREVIEIGVEEKYHYPMECCEGCVVNNNWRWWCEAIDFWGHCKHCKCYKDEHDRRFYKTEKSLSNLLTAEAEEKMKMAASAKERLEMAIKALKERKDQLMLEQRVIADADKKFAKFLQVHALTKPPEPRTTKSDTTYYKVSQKYETEIAQTECLSIEEFYFLKSILLNLPINGSKIKEILDADAKGLATSVAVKETVKICYGRFKNLFS